MPTENPNNWPGEYIHAMDPAQHESWNASHYPGTRQLCSECGEPTGRCEEDSMYADEDREIGPLCESCYEELKPEENQSIGNCPKCGRDVYSELGFCGGCENP